MEPLKILHVYKDYYPILGGIENHVKTLAEAQVKAGHQAAVLVTNPGQQPPFERMDGVSVTRAWRVATVASTPLSPVFPVLLRQMQPDITHLHFPYPLGEISQLLVGRRRPFVITYHSDVVRQQMILRFYKPLLRRVLANAARILPTSDRYIDTSPYLAPLKAKCTVVPLSVDPEPFLNAVPLIPPGNSPTMVFVGRHRYYKGLETLLQAMAWIPSVRLLVGGDGPMRAKWEQSAEDLGLQDRVNFLGEVSDANLPRLYASGDVFVLPANARAEAFGKVLLEAMAAGLPCVTTEVGTGTSFVVQDGTTGLVVPPKDPAVLAEAIGRLVADKPLRTAMGQAGRARVLNMFTVEKMAARVLQVYQQVLASADQQAT